MTDVEVRIREDLHASADLIVSDREVDQAWRQVQARLAQPAIRWTRAVTVAAAVVALAAVAGLAWWQLARGSGATLPVSPPVRWFDPDEDCYLPPEDQPLGRPGGSTGFVATAREVATAEQRECRPVLTTYSHPIHGGPWGKVWLFADGRLITAYGFYDGYYEQRLTPGGVRRVLSTAAAMLPEGSGAPDGPRAKYNGAEAPEVMHQGQLIRLEDPAGFADKLFELSWLPDSAWQNERPKPYRPRWFSACYAAGNHPLDREQTLAAFPDPVAEAFDALNAARQPVEGLEEPLGNTWRQTAYCAVLPTVQIGPLVEVIQASGLPTDGAHWDPPWQYDVGVRGDAHVRISLTLIMPSGESGVLGG